MGIYNNIDTYKKHAGTIKQKLITFAFLKGAYRSQYDNLTHDLKSQYARGSNQYPTNLNEVPY